MELLPKVICYSYECINKSKQTNFLTLRKLFGTTVLTKKSFKYDYIYKIEPRMQICLRNPRVACSTDHVSNIQLIDLKHKFTKLRRHLKICVTSAIHVLIKAYPHLICHKREANNPIIFSLLIMWYLPFFRLKRQWDADKINFITCSTNGDQQCWFVNSLLNMSRQGINYFSLEFKLHGVPTGHRLVPTRPVRLHSRCLTLNPPAIIM